MMRPELAKMEEKDLKKTHSRERRRRILAAVAVLAAMAVSAAYGFLLKPHRLFPYGLLNRRHVAAHTPKGLEHARPASGGTIASRGDLERLTDLPYLRGYRPPTVQSGVLIHDRSRAENGLNFFTSSHAPVAILMDMDGAVMKSWTADAGKVFPGYRLDAKHEGYDHFFRDAELLPDGGIVALFNEIGIVRLDPASRVLWTFPGHVHHDLFIGQGGTVWALAHEKRVVTDFRDHPVLEDFILLLSPEGKLLRRISVLDCFRQSEYAPVLASVPSETEDIFHTNSLIVLDGSLANRSPAFRRGNLLLSFRNLSMIAVVDPDEGRIVWALTGLWRGQHSARLPSNGHLVLFDDLGSMRKASRVLEVDPFTQEVVWSFSGLPGQELLSESGGYVERLRGGNTLITETNNGRVFEVTPDNRVVWEFANPNRVGKNNELVAILYFMERVPRNLPFLSGPANPPPSKSSAVIRVGSPDSSASSSR